MRKFYDIEQNSDEWFNLRLGLFTASSIDKIMGATTNKGYQDAIKKVAFERLSGKKPQDSNFSSSYMQRGHELEPDGVIRYEEKNSVQCITAGFGTYRDIIGASPDRLIIHEDFTKSGLEMKCPAYTTMIDYAIKPEKLVKDYIIQCQTQILVYDLEYVDLVAFHPDFELIEQRIYPDLATIDEIVHSVESANDLVLEMVSNLKGKIL